MRIAKPRVLLTGFGPFPGVDHNATTVLVPKLAAAARRHFPAYRFAAVILPTEWGAAPAELARQMSDGRPRLAVHFGVSREAKGFVVETTGRNACRDTADAAGSAPASRCIAEDGPDTRPTLLPVGDIVARLASAGLPVTTSDDAGGYLCNAVLYHSLGHCTARPDGLRAGFVHIPADLGTPAAALTFEQGIAGGLEIVAACLDHLGEPARRAPPTLPSGPALARRRANQASS